MILEKDNIFINEASVAKEEIIKRIGRIFAEKGYTNEHYGTAMLEKEKVFNTYIGNGVAIPHGIESAKDDILKTGLVLMTFKEGIDWGAEDKAKVVIGIAARGTEHIDVLSKIAIFFLEKENTEKILAMSKDEISILFED